MASREETETVIVINDADEFAIVDTMHGRYRRACQEVIRRTGRGRERNQGRGIRESRKVRVAERVGGPGGEAAGSCGVGNGAGAVVSLGSARTGGAGAGRVWHHKKLAVFAGIQTG